MRTAADRLITWCGENASRHLVVSVGTDHIVDEAFGAVGRDDPADVASIQKSVVSLIIARLVADGVLGLDDPVSRHLGRGWTRLAPDDEDRVTLRHVMTLTTGLFDDFTAESAPGDSWYYNNRAYHRLHDVVERATGRTTADWCDELVLEPFDMACSGWSTRPNGMRALQSTGRDLARFGRGVLAELRGAELVVGDTSLMRTLVTASQELNPSFAMLWWLPTASNGITPGPPRGEPHPLKSFGGRSFERPLASQAPADTLCAMGAGSQRVYIVDSLDLVVTRTGTLPADPTTMSRGFDAAMWDLINPVIAGG